MRPPSAAQFRTQIALLLAVRALVAVALTLGLAPISVDDYFRVFHARWWWDHVSFSSSYEWLPGYQYVYGPLVGLTDDMVLAPRILTAALHLGAAAVVARLGASAPRGATLLAIGVLLFSPLSLVLGTVPLSESLFICLGVSGAALLARYLERGDVRIELAAAVLYLAAATVRFEGFALAGVFTAVALSRRPANIDRGSAAAVALVPWIFPAVWSALMWASSGDPFHYLRNIRDDHFGPGDVLAALLSPEGIVTAALAIGACAASVVRLGAAARRGAWSGAILELHAILFAGIAAAAVASGNVPSQYPLRILYPVIAFGALPLGCAAAAVLEGHGRALGVALLGAGVAFAGAGFSIATLSSGIPAEDLAAAAAIRSALDRGQLGADGQVVIEHELPSAACLFVFANDAARVHIDALGDTCSPKVLTEFKPFCPMPPWTGDVRLAVVREGTLSERFVAVRRWALVRQIGGWRFYLRPRP